VRISTKLFRKIGPRPDDRDQWSWTFFWDHRYFEILNWTVQMISMYKSATASDWLYLYTVIYLLHIVPVWLHQTKDHGRSLLDSWIPIYTVYIKSPEPCSACRSFSAESIIQRFFSFSLPLPPQEFNNFFNLTHDFPICKENEFHQHHPYILYRIFKDPSFINPPGGEF
jgi:hypothetical protein